LLCWAAPVFVFFELAPTKLAHYAMPAYPAIALLCGAGLLAVHGRRWRSVHPAGVTLFAVAGGIIVAFMALAATFMPGDAATDLRRAISAALVGVGIVAAAVTGLIMLRRPAARAAVLVGCALALSFSLRERILPEARELNVSGEVVAALTRARLQPTDTRPLWVVGYSEPSFIFLTRTSVRLATPANAGAQAQLGEGMVIEGEVLEETAAQLALRQLMFLPSEAPVRGLALGRGEFVELSVGEVAALTSDAPGAAPPRNP
jgi:4-amino-4-deoxy-L-arabinose transferase-like glycosyltransferase